MPKYKPPPTGFGLNDRRHRPTNQMDKISIADYKTENVDKFNPTKFDAQAFVKLAKDAGMKYLVITAKHHDGFSMFHSKCSPYNVVDATPFKRDIPAQAPAAGDWEVCMPISGSWGYKRSDTDFKSPTTLIRNLADIASKGGNYLHVFEPTRGSTTAPTARRSTTSRRGCVSVMSMKRRTSRRERRRLLSGWP